MGNRWLTNGSSYITTPTLGDILSSTVRVVCKDASWLSSGNAGFLFSQAASTGANREFAMYSLGGNLTLIAGGVDTEIMSAAEVIAEIDASSVLTGDIDLELNFNTGAMVFKVGGVTYRSETVTVGAGRNDGTLFRLGARSASDTPGTTGGFIITSGNKIGDTDIYINGTISRSYAMPTSGTSVQDSTSFQTGTLQSGTGGTADWEAGAFFGADIMTLNMMGAYD